MILLYESDSTLFVEAQSSFISSQWAAVGASKNMQALNRLPVGNAKFLAMCKFLHLKHLIQGWIRHTSIILGSKSPEGEEEEQDSPIF